MYTLITLSVKHFLALREAERKKKSYFMSLPTVIKGSQTEYSMSLFIPGIQELTIRAPAFSVFM